MAMTFRIAGGVLRPRLGFTLFALCGLLALIALGCWQLQRMAWKHALIAKIEQRMAAAPVPMPLTPDDPEAFDYRRVQLTGTFHHDREMYIAAHDVRYSVYGSQVLTPFETPDHSFVLVSRGWVPPEKKKPETRAEGQVAGTVTLTGIARVPHGRSNMFMPDNSPSSNFWLWEDLPAMAQFAGVAQFAPLVLEVDAAPNPGGYPVGGQTRISFPDNHAVYAITWFALAVILVIIWFVKFWEREKKAV